MSRDNAIESGKTRVLVTGATGFIGRNLVDRLLTDPDLDIRVIARAGRVPGDWASRGVEVVEGDLRNPGIVRQAATGVDRVFHLAGLTRARNEGEFLAANAALTYILADLVRHHSPGARFVHVSSLAATGPSDEGPVDENSPLRPVSAYGRSKVASEEALRSAAGAALAWTIIRPPAVYGPFERDIFTLFRMVRRGVAPILGLSSKSYSFVYVDDLVEAMLRVAVSDKAIGQVYFAASPEVRSDVDMVHAIESAIGRRAFRLRLPHFLIGTVALWNRLTVPLRRSPALVTFDRLRELTARRWVCSSDKLAREVGYSCPTSLQGGIARTAEWYRRQGWLH